MFISLSQLKIEVRKAKINSFVQYRKNRKKHWPSNPDQYYKDEWISWTDLFGKEKVEYVSLSKSLSQLKVEVRKAKINSFDQYRKNRKKHWPSNPGRTCKDEWISWPDLFGKEKVEYVSLSKLKIEVIKAGINSRSQYFKNRKKHWHSKPEEFYKDEWISWIDLFGKEKITLSQLKVEVRKAGVFTVRHYKKNRKKDWPSAPDKYYKEEWISWTDLFGKEKIEYFSLSQLKIEVRKACVNNEPQYRKNRKKHWPSNPDKYYKNEWISWNDLFGKSFNLKQYIVRKLSA